MKKTIILLLVLSLLFTNIGCSKDNIKSEVEKQDQSDAVEVDKKLTNVEITIPAFFLESDDEEDIDIDQITEEAKKEGIKEVTLNDDGSVTYTMSKATHKELLESMGNGIDDSITELINNEDFSSIKGIIPNKSFSEFEVVVDKEIFENSFDGFAVLGLVFQSMFYQLFEGVEPDNYKVLINYKDDSTGQVFNTITYPDAFNE
jgi:hypothetical protein